VAFAGTRTVSGFRGEVMGRIDAEPEAASAKPATGRRKR
jgi:hypothetical protein